MEFEQVDRLVDEYIEKNWETVVDDIARLVRIPSVERLDEAADGAPFGPGPRAAADEAIALCERLGFETHDLEGYMIAADMPGESERQLGFIAHIDVVDAGDGWDFEPFELTRKDGYLVGRGISDDKGPAVVGLHAMRFWLEQGVRFPRTIRMLLGANEESGMRDITYFLANYEQPDFVITPDAAFPVSYGEKGMLHARVTSVPIAEPSILAIEGGTVPNAVPGTASATVRGDYVTFAPGPAVKVTAGEERGTVHLAATGRSAHASMPEAGKSAIAALAAYLLQNELCNEDEKHFLELVLLGAARTDGAGYGIACSDDDFGPLTMVIGTMGQTPEGALTASLDIRYPTTIDSDRIVATLQRGFDHIGAKVEVERDYPTFLVGRDSPEVVALMDVYNKVTGRNDEPITMGGGTYARKFNRGVSFGPTMPDEPLPDWAGALHGPNEAMAEQQLKDMLRIYIHAIARLMESED
ncbi:MAG: Sapep family Mn(2+)-dependent dipeptidase [Coriobacteriales bacterium]|jgi:succinyl-diaminopimelate desuccinylase